MAYRFYIGGMALPITPEKLEIDINNGNKTATIIDLGQINMLKRANLTEVSFEFLLPAHKYPFAQSSSVNPQTFLNKLKKLKANRKKFQFIVTRTMPNGKSLFRTNLKCSLESYTIKEDAEKYGTDIAVSVKLKQYKAYSTKTVTITPQTETTATATTTETRAADSSPAPASPQTYTVKKGDTLWAIAKKYYGDGSKYMTIANASGISNPDLINIGQVLTIPTA